MLQSLLSFTQTTYPKPVLCNNDTCIVLTLQQFRDANHVKVDLIGCEMRDSIMQLRIINKDSTILNYESVIVEKNKETANLLYQIESHEGKEKVLSYEIQDLKADLRRSKIVTAVSAIITTAILIRAFIN